MAWLRCRARPANEWVGELRCARCPILGDTTDGTLVKLVALSSSPTGHRAAVVLRRSAGMPALLAMELAWLATELFRSCERVREVPERREGEGSVHECGRDRSSCHEDRSDLVC